MRIVLRIVKSLTHLYKHWWDDELTDAKSASALAHREWVNLGKPKSGIVWQTMQKKNYYKILIKNKENLRKVDFPRSCVIICWKKVKMIFGNNGS